MFPCRLFLHDSRDETIIRDVLECFDGKSERSLSVPTTMKIKEETLWFDKVRNVIFGSYGTYLKELVAKECTRRAVLVATAATSVASRGFFRRHTNMIDSIESDKDQYHFPNTQWYPRRRAWLLRSSCLGFSWEDPTRQSYTLFACVCVCDGVSSLCADSFKKFAREAVWLPSPYKTQLS